MDNKEYTISEVVDSFGVNAHTWITFVLLAFAMIFDGYDFMIVNSTNMFVAPTFWPDVEVPTTLMGSLTTWGLLGMVIGGAIGGIMSDKLGRKKTLVFAVIFYGLFTLPQAFCKTYIAFAMFRLVAGLGVGSCIPVVTTVFSESTPTKNRGVFVTFGMAFMVAGWVLAGLIANPICNNPEQVAGFCELVTPLSGQAFYANWRICYLIGAIPIIYGIILIFAMKETPHWYANAGQRDKAVEALQRLEKSIKGTVSDYDPNLMIVPPKPEKTGPNVLFSNKFIVGTAAIWTLYFVGQFCVYGMNAWLPTWFKGIGYTPAQAVALQTWNNVAAILSNVCVGVVSDAIGRKKNLIFAWLFCIAAICICSIFVAPGHFGFCIFLMLLFGFALNYAITAVQPLMPETYPTALRNTGTAWCQAFARFGGSASSIVLGAIAAMAAFQGPDGTEWAKVVLVLNVPFVLGLVCSILFVQKETARVSMESLSEVQDASDTGMVPFIIIMIIALFLALVCIALPLIIKGFAGTPAALPMMATGLLLPFVYFFIFAGPKAVAKAKANKAA